METYILSACSQLSVKRPQYYGKIMYSTQGIEAVATITELRSKTSELVEHAKSIERGILVQKNNEPYAVLISYDLYIKLLGKGGEGEPKRRGRKKSS